MAEGLLIIGIVVLIGFAGNVLFSRTKIPEVLFLILVGIIIGPVTGIVGESQILIYGPLIASLMLIVVMLDNGLSFDIFKIAKTLQSSIAFSLSIMAATAITITLVLNLTFGLPILLALIIALVLSGTTTDVITIIVSKMHVTQKTKQLLVMESVINDFQIIAFFLLLGFAETSRFNSLSAVFSILLIPISLIIGMVVAFLWLFVIGKFLGKNNLNYIATLGILFILYNAVQLVGGSGAVVVLAFSLVIGNSLNIFKRLKIKHGLSKKLTPSVIRAVRQVEVDVSFFVRTIFFVFLGMAFSFNINNQLIISSAGVLAGIFICRYVIVRMFASRIDGIYKSSVSSLVWIAPRGYVAAVLAFAALNSGLFSKNVVELVLINIFITTVIAITYSIYHEARR